MPTLRLLSLLLVAGAMTAHAQEEAPEEQEELQTMAAGIACCSITAISARTGVVTARERSTGKTFRFQVKDRALLQTLKVGHGVWADFAARQVSVRPAEPAGNPSVNPAEPAGQPTMNPGAACCAILPEVNQ